MLHVWLVPALVVLFLLLCGFYLFLKFKGGTGERTDGQTVLDKPSEDEIAE